MYFVPWGENLIPDFPDYVSRSFILFCRNPKFMASFFSLQVSVKSSVNRNLDWWLDVRMSLITIKNNVTLITPLWIMVGLERVPFVFTWIVLFERKFLIKVRMLPFILILVRASMTFILGIEL